jgi:diguanylate cyclase (GGDEF)-like protein
MRVDLRVRLEALIFDPSRTGAIFWLGGAAAILSVLPDGQWSHHSLVVLLSSLGCSAIAGGSRYAIGDRLPLWSLHVDLVIATAMISVGAAIGPGGHVNFAALYTLIILYAILYLRPFAAVLQIGAAGAAYAVVLVVGPDVAKPVIAWLSVFGTGMVWGAIVFVLVSLLRRTSREDPLTRMANRRSWDERTDEELERARRNKTPLSLAVIDIDNFKAVNDSEGHQAGDLLLCKLADEWGGTIRGSGDFMARLGGDEFGLLAPGSDGIGIERVVERLRAISQNGVSCSFGVATWNGTETAANLFRRADEAMYQIKRERRAD